MGPCAARCNVDSEKARCGSAAPERACRVATVAVARHDDGTTLPLLDSHNQSTLIANHACTQQVWLLLSAYHLPGRILIAHFLLMLPLACSTLQAGNDLWQRPEREPMNGTRAVFLLSLIHI